MPQTQMEVAPIAGALGAEIHGVSLANVDDATFEAIHDAFLAHQVIFFRDQEMSIDEHKAFASRFGELHVHAVLQQMADQGHPEVVVLESDAKRPFVAARWHSDVTFEEFPPLGSVLRGRVVPDSGGDTMWASMYAAYDGLSDAMQGLLSGLEALHDGGGFKAIATKAQKADLESRQTARHPVVRTHPETGRKALYVNATFTKRIVGMKPAESDALLGFLFQHIENPDYHCRFRWRTNSVAMWDNRCTQHRVVQDNLAAHRRMERITIIGDRPVA